MLRKELGFDGVIISDDLQMGAVTKHYGFENSVRLAINAGCDILLFSNNFQYEEGIAEKAVATILRLVQEGVLSEKRINESYERIMELKGKLEQGE